MSYLPRPKLRRVNVEQTVVHGEPCYLLRDNLNLTDAYITLPEPLVPVAQLCDGEHTLRDMQTKLVDHYGFELPLEMLENLVSQFDQALLLEGGRFEQTQHEARQAYRQAEYRTPSRAGLVYPDKLPALRRLFDHYVTEAGEIPAQPADTRAIVSPHIDYMRGGPVYARVWESMAQAVSQAELIIILATDHNGGLGNITLTPQSYASPFGVLPTDTALVNELAELLGEEAVFAEELHHIDEHAIELVFVWLQYIQDKYGRAENCQVVPILCGSFYHFMLDEADIRQEESFSRLNARLQTEMTRRRTLIVTSGDLAHLGPAFDGPPLHQAEYRQMALDDQLLLQNLCTGDAQRFFDFMKAGQYERNVCGLSPFYFTLDLLGDSTGEVISYGRCPADEQNTSFVSVGGVVLR